MAAAPEFLVIVPAIFVASLWAVIAFHRRQRRNLDRELSAEISRLRDRFNEHRRIRWGSDPVSLTRDHTRSISEAIARALDVGVPNPEPADNAPEGRA